MIAFLVEIDEYEQLTHREWSTLVRRRDGMTCRRCSEQSGRLDTHHIDGDKRNNCLANGECLCVKCHGSETNTGRTYEGRVVPESVREKIRKSRTGQRLTESTKRKLSDALRGRNTRAEADIIQSLDTVVPR